MKIKCIVIDDEAPAIDQMTEYIQRIPFLECIQTFDNAIDPVTFLKSHPVDLVFLDIEMERFTGIQFIRTLRLKPKVILTTAYDSYALEAFDLDVADYLLKPISFERFFQAVEKVYHQFHDQAGVSAPVVPLPTRSYMFVKTEYRFQRIDFCDILFIEGMKEYLGIQTRSERILVLQSFADILAILPPDLFFRVHKSYIVAVDKIDRIERNRISIASYSIPVSETYKQAFLLFLSGKTSS
ncbi:MAG: response regulator transcription factor [Bacteroidales bacterium]|nr:response regulator transcription factor [Bacteroidales bacterium]